MMRAEKTTDNTRHFPGGAHSHSAVGAVSRRDGVLISTCLLLVTALAWAYLVHLERQMSASMDHDMMMAEMGMAVDRPWTVAEGLFTFAMWVVMMVGMMAGAATPMLLLFAATHAKRQQRGVPLAVLMFGAGYLAVWVGFSACAAVAQWVLHQAAMLSLAMTVSSTYLAGAILIIAGAYQLTPWKAACLTQCRSPLGFLMTNWRDGTIGALQMGVRHGVYCLGCCWALMGVLFVVGVMNLVWVAALTGLVLLEKVGPAGAIVARISGTVMVVCGILVITAKV